MGIDKVILGDKVMKRSMVDVGAQIQRLRKEKGLSQEQVAEAIDISVNHLGNIENGKNNFSVSVLLGLCEFFNVTPDYILLGCNNAVDDDFIEVINDKLRLCSGEDRSIIMTMVNAFVERNKRNRQG